LLGATLQATFIDTKTERICHRTDKNAERIGGRDLLDNNQVNFISSLVTALAAAAISLIMN
jgi:uncharacterized membrane protein